MVICHTTFWGITSVTTVYILIAFADYSTVKFVIEFEDSTRWALLRIINIRKCSQPDMQRIDIYTWYVDYQSAI